MRQQHTQLGRGFTLIETLLYLALTTGMIGVLGGVGVAVLANNAKGYVLEELGYNGHFILEKIVTAVHSADSIDGPINNATSSTLTLTMPDVAKDPTVFTVSNGVVTISEGGNPPAPLSTGGVRITDLIFRDVSYPDSSDLVRIEMTVEVYNPENRKVYDADGDFYSTAGIKATP